MSEEMTILSTTRCFGAMTGWEQIADIRCPELDPTDHIPAATPLRTFGTAS